MVAPVVEASGSEKLADKAGLLLVVELALAGLTRVGAEGAEFGETYNPV